MNWSSKLDGFGREILSALGHDPNWLPTDHNPITRALQSPDFVQNYSHITHFNRTSLSKVATICQMAVYDAGDGPENDGKSKALRRHWYAWYKVHFAQPLHAQLDPNTEFNGTAWAGRLSQIYGYFVDEMDVTYRRLWVDDASRMMERWWETLFRGCNIIVAVEKDSLFADFKTAAHALGAKSLLSGKGKNSKAATEKLLREHFGWRDTFDPFSSDEPLIILHISDHDCDGEAIIGPTFGEQARRYTNHIREARVGIRPEQVDNWPASWYEVKVTNSGYTKWAERQALFAVECVTCGYQWPAQGISHSCPQCYLDIILTIKVNGRIAKQPHGLEVEALPTRNYYALLVDALLEALPFEYIVEKLRDECTANARRAAEQIAEGIFESNDTYQALLREFDRLEEIKADFEQRVKDKLEALGEPHIEDWRDDDDDPKPDDYRQYLKQANDWTGPWRPFRTQDRTNSLIKWLKENEHHTIEGFKNEVVEW
jgi:hypothetical protein